MGIERFFSTISNVSNLWTDVKEIEKKKPNIILIDFNSIVHFLSSNIQDENLLLENIRKYLINFMKNIINNNSLETIYLAIDGIPSFGKLREQLKRRYMGELINLKLNNKSKWSKNNITPGTKFMKKLNQFLLSLHDEFKTILPNLKNFIVSTSEDKGEGEMKIIDFLKNLNLEINSEILIYSPDSDMVLLNLMIKSIYKVNLIRLNQQTSKPDDTNYDIMSMENFRKYLTNYCSSISLLKLEEEKLIRDIILLFSIFGNDFLPKIPSINLKHDFFLVIDYYLTIIKTHDNYLISKGKVNYKLLNEVFILLSKNEKENLKIEKKRFEYKNFDFALKNNFRLDILNLQERILNIILKFLLRNMSLAKQKCKNPNLSNIHQCLDLNLFYDFYHERYDNNYDFNKDALKIMDKNNFDLNQDIYYGLVNDIIDLQDENKDSYNYFFYNLLRNLDKNELYSKLYGNSVYSNYFNKKNKTTQSIIINYGPLYLYFIEPNEILDDLIVYYFLNRIIPVFNNDTITDSYKTLIKRTFNSKDKFHQNNLRRTSNPELYRLEKYLDEYYDLMNPKLIKQIDDYDMFKRSYYGTNNIKQVCIEYWKGLEWIFNYYLKRRENQEWYYYYNRGPLLIDLINHFEQPTFIEKSIDFKTWEQYLMVTPLSQTNLQLLDKTEQEKQELFNKLSKILPSNLQFKDIDCSNSIFINKCHPKIIDQIDFNEILKTIRT